MIYEIKDTEIPALAKIKISAFNGQPWYDHWTLERAEESLWSAFSSPNFWGLYVVKEHVIVGYILGEKSIFMNEDVFHINELCIQTDFQRQGLGQLLLDALKLKLQREGVASLSLMTGQNPSIQGFYKRNGFKIQTDVVMMETKI